MISVKLPAVNLQSSTETTSHPRSLPGQGPTYTSIHSPTSLTKIGTEGGEFLAPLPYGIFFSILYLGHEVRRKYLCPIILEERLARFFPIFFHPSNPSIFFVFSSWNCHRSPTAANILPCQRTFHSLILVLHIHHDSYIRFQANHSTSSFRNFTALMDINSHLLYTLPGFCDHPHLPTPLNLSG